MEPRMCGCGSIVAGVNASEPAMPAANKRAFIVSSPDGLTTLDEGVVPREFDGAPRARVKRSYLNTPAEGDRRHSERRCRPFDGVLEWLAPVAVAPMSTPCREV